MEKIETLKDGIKVVIRELTLNDLKKMMKFYRSFPLEDRKYLDLGLKFYPILGQKRGAFPVSQSSGSSHFVT
jgi:hypothetical protein